MVHAGNLVRANDTTPLVVINQVTPIYVIVRRSRGAAAGVEALHGAAARSASRRGRRTTTAPPSVGRITFVDNAVDPTTGTIKVKGTFPNDDRRLWPGQFVNVVVTLTTDPNAIVVPTAAVQTGQQGTYVFVVKPDQTVELRPVTVARTRGDETVIKQGLTAGRDGRHRRPAAARAGQPRQRQDRGAGRRRRHEPLRALHQAAGHDDADHARASSCSA